MYTGLTAAIEYGRLWNEFWDTSILFGHTINYIPPPVLGPVTLPAALILIAAAIFSFIVILKRSLSRETVTRAAFYSFLAIGFIFAMRIDYNWLVMFKDDLAGIYGKDTDERIVTLMGNDLYHFINFVKKTLPPGEAVREVTLDKKVKDYFTDKHGDYFLLPVETSRSATFLWVYNFSTASYDPETSVLKVGSASFKALPYAVYGNNAAIFRILEDLR